MVHLRSKKIGLEKLPQAELPKVRETLQEGGHLFLPLILLVIMLVVFQKPPMYSVFWSILALVVTAQFRKTSRLSFKALVDALVMSSKNALLVIAVTGTAGIVIGIVNLTGLGINLGTFMIAMSGDSLIILLILTMIASIILGMGLPTTACYVILAALIAPALIRFGIEPLAAHFFVFYFGILAAITPPIGDVAYIAAGIAKSEPLATALEAVKLGIAAYIVPFMFVFSPAIAMIGTLQEIIIVSITAFIGVTCLAIAIEGYLFESVGWFERILLAICAILFIDYRLITDLIALFLATLVIGWLWYRSRHNSRVDDAKINVSL